MRTEEMLNTKTLKTSLLDTLPAALPQRVLLSMAPLVSTLVLAGLVFEEPTLTISMLLLSSILLMSPKLVASKGTSVTGHIVVGTTLVALVLPVALADAPAQILLILTILPFLATAWLSEREALQWSVAPAIIVGLLGTRAGLKGSYEDMLWAALSIVTIITGTGFAFASRDALQIVASGSDPRQRSKDKEFQAVLEALEIALGSSAKKDRFLSLMSFELRTPLTAIIGYSELLSEILEDIGTEHDVRETRAIEASSRRLLHVVDDILDLSQIGAGTLELRSSPVDLTAIVKLALDTVTEEYPKVEISAEIAQTGLIMGDQDRLGRIVSNLVAQAVKGASPGDLVHVLLTGRIRAVSLIVESAPDRVIPEDVKRLREGLLQPIDEQPLHLGLELTVADSLLRTMQGELSVDIGPRGELRFVATLPIQQAFSTLSYQGDAA